jgi:hypothetical protein
MPRVHAPAGYGIEAALNITALVSGEVKHCFMTIGERSKPNLASLRSGCVLPVSAVSDWRNRTKRSGCRADEIVRFVAICVSRSHVDAERSGV